MTDWRVTFSLLSSIAAAAWHFAPLTASTPMPRMYEATVVIEEQDPGPLIDRIEDELGRVDIRGNVIREAVGDYRIDSSGEAYETHAPEVILTHLAPPGA